MAGREEDGEEAVPFRPRYIEGVTLAMGTEDWDNLELFPDAVVEVNLTSSSVGSFADEWFTVLVTATSHTEDGIWIQGKLVGVGDADSEEEVRRVFALGDIHLCKSYPCSQEVAEGIHAQVIRVWNPANYSASWVTGDGKRLVTLAGKRVVQRGEERAKKRKQPAARGRDPGGSKNPGVKSDVGKGRGDAGRRQPKKPAPPRQVIEVLSDGEEQHPEREERGEDEFRANLRARLRSTKERILGKGRVESQPVKEEDVRHGREPGSSSYVVPKRLVAGTSLRRTEELFPALEDAKDTRDGDLRGSKKKRSGSASEVLLAQAVQSSKMQKAREKKKKKKKGPIRQLVDLLKGKKAKKRKQQDGGGDPGDPDDEDGGSGEESTSSAGNGQRSENGSGSEESCEAPLRKKANKEPGSVMRMLIKHAQEQLDRGALLEGDDVKPSLVSGVKITTYFALLIRPYHSNNSPLLRELYALGQAIDLLRSGRLPECADALASRYIAVHTALQEGTWQTAAQLELYPLEPTQSASTATMLQAHRHRRLVLKSQGINTNRWWGASGKGKGAQGEKGKKGDQKGKKGKGKGGGRDGNWNGKGNETNPWKDNKEDPGAKKT